MLLSLSIGHHYLIYCGNLPGERDRLAAGCRDLDGRKAQCSDQKHLFHALTLPEKK